MRPEAVPFVTWEPHDGVVARPIVGHVPHASRHVPATVRPELDLDASALAEELRRLTDSHTDALFDGLRAHGATLFAARFSRLVFDPERFIVEGQEPTESVGQGVVYTHGSRRQRIRTVTPEHRSRRIEQLYRPYHAALSDLVARDLEVHGSCWIIDCHSFASEPLASESDQRPGRPDICIGTSAAHSPAALVEDLEAGFTAHGLDVRRDEPFEGTFVPSAYLGRDRRVHSVMIEVRRGLYMDEATGERSADLARTAATISAVAAGAIEASLR